MQARDLMSTTLVVVPPETPVAALAELLAAADDAPGRYLVDIGDVGALAAFLVSDGARRITGTVIPVDGGQHMLA